jgi:ornithine cyclodeaminase/alanine dehydrogenase-like protein (mu-crystallin family)
MAIVEAIEMAFRRSHDSDVLVPPRPHLKVDGKTILLMPAVMNSHFAVKIVSLVKDNPSRGLPLLHGVVLLCDGNTGRPIALLEGGMLTSLRTGAIGAAGIRSLAPRNSSQLGIVGAGVQGHQLARLALGVRPIRRVHIFDPDEMRATKLATHLGQLDSALQVNVHNRVEDVITNSDVIITATTSTTPVLPDDPAIYPGKTIVAVGSYKPSARELSRAVFRYAPYLFVDTMTAFTESGDVLGPIGEGLVVEDRVVELGEIIKNPDHFHFGAGATRIFKSVGSALFDLAVARVVVDTANANHIGTEVDM